MCLGCGFHQVSKESAGLRPRIQNVSARAVIVQCHRRIARVRVPVVFLQHVMTKSLRCRGEHCRRITHMGWGSALRVL